jgi:hypothetical protein
MNGEIDPIKTVIGIFTLVIFGIIAVIILSSMSNIITKDQCKPLQEQVDQMSIELKSKDSLLNETTQLLLQCKLQYQELSNNTITRKDFEDVKGYFNLTQIQIDSINKKIDGINRVYNLYNININNYSFAINIVFAIEVISLLFFKSEFLNLIISLAKKKKQKEKKEVEQNEQR